MHEAALDNASLTIAIALAVGMLAQSLARHLRVPGIVLLLGAGVLLGPDGLDLVRPGSLGETLHSLVGFAVAIILFEGGMNLNVKRLRREARSIRRLVSLGAVVTLVGGALTTRYVLDWDWTRSLLFGALVIVTGPTVVTPLLRRIRVAHRVATVLEAEGVLGDAIGALVAVVALEIAITPVSLGSLARAPTALLARMGVGLAVGLFGGLVISAFLRRRRIVPEGLENAFALSLALLIYQSSGALLHESGIVAVTIAGIVVGNRESHALSDLREFKEQLTMLVIGMLFVILAADIRVEEVHALGRAGIGAVLVLMLVVRPLTVLVGTAGSDLTVREKAFLSWLAPRGIVAAAISSLFAETLQRSGIEGGGELRALVFLVIAVTVTVHGLTGGLVARLLGVARKAGEGYVILGAGQLGRAFGRTLRDAGEDVVFLDSNHDACRAAEAAGFRVLHGSGLNEAILMRAGLDGRGGAIAVSANDEVNLLFGRLARQTFRVENVWLGLRKGHLSVNAAMVKKLGAKVLFGAPRRIELWDLRLERGVAKLELWKVGVPGGIGELSDQKVLLPMLVRRSGRWQPVSEELQVKNGDALMLGIFEEGREEAQACLTGLGLQPLREADEMPSQEPVREA
jgi:NhaP-type Na+/H+ or K+/H+ antiporter